MAIDELHKVHLQILCSLRCQSVQLAKQGADDGQYAEEALGSSAPLIIGDSWIRWGNLEVRGQTPCKAGWVVWWHAQGDVCQAESMQGLHRSELVSFQHDRPA